MKMRMATGLGIVALMTGMIAQAEDKTAGPAGACPAVTRVRVFPAKGAAQKMVGGRFTGSDDGKTTGFETFAKITSAPAEGQWTEIPVEQPVRRRYLKYEAPNDSWGMVAEIEFHGGDTRIAGETFGTVGSRDNKGTDFGKALDGDTETFFEGAEPNNQYAGIDLGPAAQAAAPELSPGPGNYPAAQTVTIASATPGAKIRYALGGGTPRREWGDEYRQPVPIGQSAVLAAVAYRDDLAASPVVVAPYRIGDGAGAGTVRTFHIGNSLTDTVDGWLKATAESAGRKLDFHRFTIPGAPTDWLWEHPGSGFGDSRYLEAFAALAPIDHIITQPFAGHGRGVENESDHSGRFYDACRKHSPNVRFWFYQQWPSRNAGEGWSKGTLNLGGKDIEAWRSRIVLQPGETLVDGGWMGVVLKQPSEAKSWDAAVTNHTRFFGILRDEMQRKFPDGAIGVIPGGQALLALKQEIEAGRVPDMADFFGAVFADDIHLTDKGRYLISLVHYACIYGESPEGKASAINSGLTPEQTAIFQRIAWQAVKAGKGAGTTEAGAK